MLTQTQKSVETHSYSGKKLGDFSLVVKHLLQIKIAAAHANFKLQNINQEKFNAIEKACIDNINYYDSKNFPVDVYQGGGGVALNMNINERIVKTIIRRKILPSSQIDIEDINKSQSTADVCTTGLQLTIFHLANGLKDNLSQMANSLKNKSKENCHIQTIARTCLRDAEITTYGEKFNAIAERIDHLTETLNGIISQLKFSRLGSTAIGSYAGSSYEFQRLTLEKLNEITGVHLECVSNAIDFAQHNSSIASLLGFLENLAITLIKICKDMRLLGSGPISGFKEILFDPIIQGSSFYQNKTNPTIIETLLQACFRLLGYCRTIQACFEHGELDLNVFEIMMGFQLTDSIRMISKAISNTTQYGFDRMTVDKQHCEYLVSEYKKLNAKGEIYAPPQT